MVYTLQRYSSAYKYYLYLVLCLAYVVAVPGALPLLLLSLGQPS